MLMTKTRTRPNKALRAKPAQSKTLRGKTARRSAQASKTSRAKSPPQKIADAKSSREKVSAHRKRMRAKGLRLVQMWLPDTRTPEFAEQAHRASLAIANSPTEAEDQAFIDSVQWWSSEEADALWRSEPEGWWREPED
jgi:Protein  of unknown function (DUF3018)